MLFSQSDLDDTLITYFLGIKDSYSNWEYMYDAQKMP